MEKGYDMTVKEDKDVTETVFYQCPNDCLDATFCQVGKAEESREMTETGKDIESNFDEYAWIGESVVKCKK